ncbi:MAG: nucleotide exchange factor GrpE [Microcoleaceae cyanobacterium]
MNSNQQDERMVDINPETSEGMTEQDPEVLTTSEIPPTETDPLTGQVSDEAQSADAEILTTETEAASGDQSHEQLQMDLAGLASVNESLKAQMEDVSSQYRRLAADFDNFRKRTQKEKEELELQIKCSTIKKLLPVVDNFERARSQIKPQTDEEMAIHKSYQGVYKQMVESLKQLGVSPMRPEGELFDPNLHEAVMREPTNDHPEDTVIEEMMRGYLLGDRVLRHAMVKVATAASEETASTSTEAEA